jgi:UDP-glucose 4-epimerase
MEYRPRMKVLITGGCGYLGGRLAQVLASRAGNEIVLGSRQSSESPSWLPQAKIIKTQWDSQSELEQICVNTDAVVHLAGMNAEDSINDPVGALEFNGVATARLLRAAVRMRVKRFVYISTAHVYCSPLVGVISESTCPASLHPYAASHRAGEDVVRFAHESKEIEGIVVRLSNVYGAPAHENTDCWKLLVNDLCRQAVSTQRMVLRTSGLDRRDFVPLPHACLAIEHLLHLPVQGLFSGLFNVGGQWSPTVWEIARTIQDCCLSTLGFRPELVRDDARITATASEPLEFRLDNLISSGFRTEGDKLTEIYRTLEFCRASLH